MRLTRALSMAEAATVGAAKPLRPAPMALLPPIPLYRRILRAHRHKLDVQMRLLGDEYVKAEFRAHRSVDNPIHIVLATAPSTAERPADPLQIGFLTEWQMYAQQLEGDAWRDAKMDKAKIDKMSDEQIAQLYELMQAIRNHDLDEAADSNHKK
ncbi:putative acn9 family domain containing protein [Neofusicoccum parvum]|uniref:Succinate dehydrogenase assembly factor 3 n=1 Tax=Botryosphaeria parva (strain UCR-NP2) TaxID=1287680 RepID=R1G9D5_BOTPV|nr:putative acn9 family domain containing protein [Neofusicoccum parvum UCRNP2]GME35368.1 putative acn9 family domain containing protein [Neofusicoccum parvum]